MAPRQICTMHQEQSANHPLRAVAQNRSSTALAETSLTSTQVVSWTYLSKKSTVPISPTRCHRWHKP